MAALNLTVTAGTNFTDDDAVTADQLNLAAAPTVELEEGTILPVHIDIDALVTDIGDQLRGTNYLTWGDIMQDRFPAASVSCANGLKTPVQPAWWVRPTGAATTVTPSARTDDDTAVEAGRSGMKIIGDASLTLMEVGTYLPPGLCQQLANGDVTVSLYLWNNTGTFTPVLKVYCSTATGDEGAVTERQSITGDSCANGAWTRTDFTFDAAATTDWSKGAHIVLCITKTASVLDSGTDYVIVADAQVDTGATATSHIKVPPVFNHVPPGTMFPFAGTVAPPGWLLCNTTTAISRTAYARLFAAIGTAYGVGDGSTTFNIPDMRGRSFVGAEVAGASQSRMEVSISVASSSGDTLTVASGAADSLRLGMGAYGNAFIPTDAYIIAITPTTIQLSAATTGSVAGTVRFSKLGAKDVETVGSAAEGMSYGRRVVGILLQGCSTAGTTTLTVPGVDQLAVGMVVSGDATVSGGQTIVGFLSATTVQLSAVASGSASALQLTFKMPAPEGDEERVLAKARGNPVIAVTWGGGAGDTTLNMGNTALIKVGMKMTGTNITANTYVASITNATDFIISGAGTTGGSSSTVTFEGAAESRATTPTPDTLPAAVGNWIIKF